MKGTATEGTEGFSIIKRPNPTKRDPSSREETDE